MDTIELLLRFPLVICKKCRVAVLPNSQWDTHFKKHDIGPRMRHRMKEQVLGNPDIIQSERELETRFQYPDREDALAQLPTYTDGLACNERKENGQRCGYMCRALTGMKEHYRKEHDWSNDQKRGGSLLQRRSIRRPWREGVHCQRLFRTGPRSGYFEVRPVEGNHLDPGHGDRLDPGHGGEAGRGSLVERLYEEIRQKQAALQNDRVEEGQRLDANPWLERMEWARHLAGFTWDTLIPLIDLPREEEIPLRIMCRSFDRMIDIGQEAMLGGHIPFFARVEINRKEQGKDPNRPFQARMEKGTKKRYQEVCHRIMGYLYRTYQRAIKPPYELTPNQRDALDELVRSAQNPPPEEETDEEDGLEEEEESHGDREGAGEGHGSTIQAPARKKLKELREIDRQCLEVWIRLLDHRLHTDHYESGLVSALAMLGIDPADRNWLTPENYTPKLSAVVKLARIMLPMRAWDQIGERRPEGLIDMIRSGVDRFMLIDRPTPMKWMFMARTYGLKIRYSTTAAGSIRWEQDTVSYQNVKFHMGQFRSWVQGLTNECRRVMTSALMLSAAEAGEADIPVIPWDRLNDNPSESRSGYCFLDHENTVLPVDGKKWMFHRAMGHPARGHGFMDDGEPPRVNEARIQRYMGSIRRFKEKLMVLMHVSGGQPARAPELLSIRHCNTKNGGRRNIFVENGMMVFVTAYHKGYALEGRTKIIHRYLPREVGELLLYYLWLIEPFQRQLEVAGYGRSFGKGYLWETGPESIQWTSDVVRRLIQRESLIGMGVKVNISSYRQMAIAIARRYLKGEGFVEDREDEDGLEDGDEEDGGRQRDSVYDLQSGHGTHVAGMIYARAILEAPGEVASMRQQYRAASEGWHRLLQFASTLGAPKRKRGWEREDQEAGFRRWKRLRQINVYDQLERVVGAGARFRGVQEEAIKAIMGGQGPILAVMGTGGGKSLLFMLPAACSAATAGGGSLGMTVVVVPLISLREDLKRRCEEAGIACAEWESRRPRTGVSIMLVTPESAVSKTFQMFLIRVKATHQLERIVIDECHVVLDSRGDFRPKLQRLGELLVAETQMVMLSATLPPSEEEEFFRCMMIPSAQVTRFRAPTTRKNVRYLVAASEGGNGGRRTIEADERVVRLVEQKLIQYPSGKIIVYGNSVGRVKEMAAALGCEAYYRDVDNKSEVFRRVVGATSRVVVATNALGLGIDMPDIRVVIHMDPIRSLRDFAQESGRAGRDGNVSESIIMIEGRPQDAAGPMTQLGDGRQCCRVILDGYLDGRVDRMECEDGEERCWRCSRKYGIEETSATRERREEDERVEDQHERIEYQRLEQERQMIREQMQWMQSDAALEVEGFQRELERWNGKCPYCYIRGEGGRTAEHGLTECSMEGVEKTQTLFDWMKRMIRYEKYSVCYDCGIPQAICRRFEANGFGRWRWMRERSCQYPDLMVGVVAAAMAEDINGMGHSILAWMEEEGVDVEDDMQTMQWMGKKMYWGEMEAAMINKVWYRLVQNVG